MDVNTIQSQWLDRRKFIKFGTCITVFPLLQMSTVSCNALFSSEAINWNQHVGAGDRNGALIIEDFDGEVLLEGIPLSKGMVVPSGRTLELKSGIVLASLPDRSIVKLSNQAIVTPELDSEKGGILTLKRGGLLAAVNSSRRRPYLIRNASAVIGVKGTVFYTQVLAEADKNGKIPAEASDYFCICNGSIDFLSRDLSRLKSDRADYHNAYFLIPNQADLSIKRAGFLLNHSDEEILELINEMKGEKHPTGWIANSKNSYSTY